MSYDPRSHTIKLPPRVKGGAPIDYLPVAERVRWFRENHPDGDIDSSVFELTADRAVFQVRVSIPGGGSATATGNETKIGFPDYIGKAETVALGRALAILGYGMGYADEFLEQREVADPTEYEVNQANPIKRAPPPPTLGGEIDLLSTTKKARAMLDAQQPTPRQATNCSAPAPGISQVQINAIAKLAKERGLTNEMVSRDLKGFFDGRTGKDLLSAEAEQYIVYLETQTAAAQPA